ncbi:phosphatidylglycerophosphatase B [Serratia microhaemolytica]|uniref:phosphatidylglycerophosphatase B n=1 Tax=Serratia microhaemolytica TaxID=2675110 RepID=UPI000FDEAA75|nr:phosphatidylglycerophosphatase B [Serratia microhaemolytica]
MLEILKRTTFGTVLLLLLPLTVWFSGWRWQPSGESPLLKLLYWVTETVSAPWGILTSLLVAVWLLYCLRHRVDSLLKRMLLLILLFSVVATSLGIKSVMKEVVREPRPFVVWLSNNLAIDQQQFYALPKQQRSLLVKTELQAHPLVPSWLTGHWQAETSFAFPSGHTVFAACWALLSLLLLPGRHYKTISVLMIWANGVMASRLLLGMHWPRDLVASVIISGILVTFAYWIAQRWLLSAPGSAAKNRPR